VRVPLWREPDLYGVPRAPGGRRDAEAVRIAISNTGAIAREVWIERPLRRAGAAQVVPGAGTHATIVGEAVRIVVAVEPGQVVEVSYTVAYGR
jgi:hypothetical protein